MGKQLNYDQMRDYLFDEIEADLELDYNNDEDYEKIEELVEKELEEYSKYDTFLDEDAMRDYLLDTSKECLDVPCQYEPYVDRERHVSDMLDEETTYEIYGKEWYKI